MRKTRDSPHTDQPGFQDAIEREGAELRSLGLSEEEITRATDPLRSFYLDGAPSIAASVGSRRPCRRSSAAPRSVATLAGRGDTLRHAEARD